MDDRKVWIKDETWGRFKKKRRIDQEEERDIEREREIGERARGGGVEKVGSTERETSGGKKMTRCFLSAIWKLRKSNGFPALIICQTHIIATSERNTPNRNASEIHTISQHFSDSHQLCASDTHQVCATQIAHLTWCVCSCLYDLRLLALSSTLCPRSGVVEKGEGVFFCGGG